MTTHVHQPLDLRWWMLYRRVFVAGVILVILGVGLMVFLAIPFGFSAWDAYQQSRREEADWRVLADKLERLQNLVTVPGFEQRDRIEALLPNEKPLLPFLNAVTTVMDAAGMPMTNLRLAPGRISDGRAGRPATGADSASGDERGKLSLQFDTSGELKAIYDLLARLERMAPISGRVASTGTVTPSAK